MAKSIVQQANRAGMPIFVQNWAFLGKMGRTVAKLSLQSIISQMDVVITPALNKVKARNTWWKKKTEN